MNELTWNKIRYTFYEPIYDLIGNRFNDWRKQSIALSGAQTAEDILLLGAGTGIDLEFMRNYSNVTAVDITPAMIETLKQRAQKLQMNVDARVMNAQKLEFPDQSFDVVFLHLILAVIPDAYACIREVDRVLKPGGTVMVMDKFLKKNEKPSILRKVANKITKLFFSEINRKIEDIVAATSLVIEEDIEMGLQGNFRILKLKKH